MMVKLIAQSFSPSHLRASCVQDLPIEKLPEVGEEIPFREFNSTNKVSKVDNGPVVPSIEFVTAFMMVATLMSEHGWKSCS